MKKIVLILLLIFSVHSMILNAASIPRSISVDRHVKIVQYDPNNVVLLKGRYGYQTQIVFAANEIVQNVSIGDSMAWQVVPLSNNLFIKPVAESTTNMTVLTNINSYNFHLDSSDTHVVPTYKLQFKYTADSYDQVGIPNGISNFDPDKINWRYSFTGDKTIAPIKIFDNGQFTYFEFKKDGVTGVPAIFIVDKNRSETLVNYHVQGKYIIVNSIAKQFTLRNGDEVASIYNDFSINN